MLDMATRRRQPILSAARKVRRRLSQCEQTPGSFGQLRCVNDDATKGQFRNNEELR
jgi:hypothetical protein